MTTIAALLRKDLLAELRRRETVPAMALFSLTAFVVFHFGLDQPSFSGQLAAGVLWVTLALASLLAVNRLFVAEHEQGGFDGFLLAPVDRTALLGAKAIALFLFLTTLELVAVPLFAVLLLGPALASALPQVVLVLVLATMGIAVVGTLTSALAVRTSARELIGPLIALPLMIPLLIAATRATAPLLAAGGPGGLPGRWLAIIGLYDLVFALLAYAVFDFLLED